MKKYFLNISVLSVLAIAGTGTAMAQAPGSGVVVDNNKLPEVTESVPEDTSSNTNNPCPEPKTALAKTPDDLAKIQEDITRFTLCVQRAQLLERLNELAESNIETIDSALNLTVSQGEEGNAMPGIMPNVPMPQLPEAVSNMLQSDDAATTPALPVARSFESGWRIRDIQGKGGAIAARLVDDNGVYLKVTKGQELPDNGGKVVSITNTVVRVSRNGQTESLKWIE